MKRLICCCCGGSTTGRQWHNRDTGYGLCVSCIPLCAPRVGVGETHPSYGIRGVHFDVTPRTAEDDGFTIGGFYNAR